MQYFHDMYIFIQHCNSNDYDDDNSMSASAKSIAEAIALLKADCESAVNWFTSNGMEASPEKFQFMIVPPHDVTDKKLELIFSDPALKSETSVKVLVITVDSRLNFSRNVNNLCFKAMGQ